MGPVPEHCGVSSGAKKPVSHVQSPPGSTEKSSSSLLKRLFLKETMYCWAWVSAVAGKRTCRGGAQSAFSGVRESEGEEGGGWGGGGGRC